MRHWHPFLMMHHPVHEAVAHFVLMEDCLKSFRGADISNQVPLNRVTSICSMQHHPLFIQVLGATFSDSWMCRGLYNHF